MITTYLSTHLALYISTLHLGCIEHNPFVSPPTVPVVVQLTANSSTSQLAVGQSVALSCDAIEGNPTDYTYSWSFTSPDDDIEMILANVTGAVYVISDIQDDEFGVYQCTANNTFDDDTSSINITEGGELMCIHHLLTHSLSGHLLPRTSLHH